MPLLYDEIDPSCRFLAGRGAESDARVLPVAARPGKGAETGQLESVRADNVVFIDEAIRTRRRFADRRIASAPIHDLFADPGSTDNVKPLHQGRIAE